MATSNRLDVLFVKDEDKSTCTYDTNSTCSFSLDSCYDDRSAFELETVASSSCGSSDTGIEDEAMICNDRNDPMEPLSAFQRSALSFVKIHNTLAERAFSTRNMNSHNQVLRHLLKASSSCDVDYCYWSNQMSRALDWTHSCAQTMAKLLSSSQHCPGVLHQAELHELLGVVFSNFGNHEEALGQWKLSEQKFMGQCTVGMVRALKCQFRIAVTSFAIQEYRGTIEACQKALFLYNLQGSSMLCHPLVVVHLRKMMGHSYMNQQKWSLSRQNYESALRWIPPNSNGLSVYLEIRPPLDYVSQREAHVRYL